ncbi:unnamed protein product [Medioppia subpectinata]|uniref:Protein-L-isoaspartate O-methyltransferase n=1 Tax=Medioppia subpectinata TaxID=1979941 RepID=A0A7R9Q0G8_9ACAR|nr:unnamed protein product [Medioppia subpectinata]CAG2108118.1 unnamed protein product [Medioppia subpectinata]
MRQYDRVYCGASCPPEHENYMKNLIKVGGILIMPLNEHLLQIRRTSDTSWIVKSVLPVSFAPLVTPTHNSAFKSVKLPDLEPLSLKEMCRSVIRTHLRKKAEAEQPSITLKNVCKNRKMSKKIRNSERGRRPPRRTNRRVIIPIFEENDAMSDDTNSTSNQRHTNGDNSNDSFSSHDEEDPNPSSQPLNGNTSGARASNSSTSSPIYPLNRIRRATGLIFKRIALADFDSDSSTSSCDHEMVSTVSSDETRADEREEEKKKVVEEDKESYSYLMRQSVNRLPLPLVLKSYLNFHRKL